MVAESHHSPESFIIYIKNRENIKKKILAISEDRTPTVEKRCLSDNRCNRSAKPDFYL